MKKLILYTLLLTISFSTAQKKELRNANKFFTSGEFASAIDLLDSSKEIFDSSDDKIKSQLCFCTENYTQQWKILSYRMHSICQRI